jgi:nucleoid DNA-binding protein
MSKFGLQDLAAAIAKKHGLEQDKTEVLVKTFFETIEEGLYEDKSVKIKGLGTFKVVEVEPRESVNVNTGERVVIEGHEKINFSPEAALKDLVNKPFAQFETVVLNDGTDFSGLKNNPEELLENLDDDPFSMTENSEDGYERNSVKKPSKGEGADTPVEENEPSMDVLQEISETSDNEDVSIDESEPEDQEEPIHILSESPEETSIPKLLWKMPL